MNDRPESPHIPRREFFSRLSDGLYGTALATLLGEDLYSSNPALAGNAVHDLTPRAPHYRPQAKAVIHLFMNGGPSQVDLFDPKPELARLAGSAPPRDILNKIEFADQVGGLLPSPYKFKRRGRCGMELSELLPHLGEVADDITLVRSMYGEHFNHEPAIYLMHSGRTLPNRPSLGSWVVYGTGERDPEPARLRGAGRPQGAAHQPGAELAVGLAAARLPGHPLSRRGAAGPEPGVAAESARRPDRSRARPAPAP